VRKEHQFDAPHAYSTLLSLHSCRYPLILCFCWFWATVNRFQNAVAPDHPQFWLFLLQVTFSHMNGEAGASAPEGGLRTCLAVRVASAPSFGLASVPFTELRARLSKGCELALLSRPPLRSLLLCVCFARSCHAVASLLLLSRPTPPADARSP
jgi:hypothetical protein